MGFIHCGAPEVDPGQDLLEQSGLSYLQSKAFGLFSLPK
jgi:hypothetical protein